MLQNGRPCIKEEINTPWRLIGDSFSEGMILQLICLPVFVFSFLFFFTFINLEFRLNTVEYLSFFYLSKVKTSLLVLLFEWHMVSVSIFIPQNIAGR